MKPGEKKFREDPVAFGKAQSFMGRKTIVNLSPRPNGAERHFIAPYHRILLEGVGHFPQRESPEQTGTNILDHLRPNSGS
jgi:pimeloyl-ACP methyl ester carboxylesterase